MPARGVVEALLPAEMVDDAVARIEQIEVGDTAGITVLPGTLDALEVLTAGDPQHCAIVTSCTEPLARDITRLLFEKQPELAAIHPEARSLSPERASTGSPAAFHPGAVSVYRDKGVWKE